MGKIILTDIDGTLVDYSNRLPDSAVAAVRRARGLGHRVYLCTGRSKAEIYPELWEIGVDGLIGANGGYVESDGAVVLHHSLTRGQVRDIVAWLTARGCGFYLESNAGLYASPGFESAGAEAIQRYQGYKGRDTSLGVRGAFPDMIFDGDLDRDDVNKISYLLNDPADFTETRARFPDLTSGTWGGRGAEAIFGDVGVDNVTKETAISALLEHLEADRVDTVALGDAVVDIPMLEFSEVSVAMGDAPPEVKKIADFVTTDVNEDGFARALDALGLTGHG